MARSWWHYWRRIGHIPKKRVEAYKSIDSSALYDIRTYPLEEGEENYFHCCLIQLFISYAKVSLPNGKDDFKYKSP
jgi:hypothetical protein